MAKNTVKKIEVSEGYALELEKSFYEKEVAKQRVDRFATMGVSLDIYKAAQEEEKESFKTYNIVWQEGINTYIPVEDRIHSADFDFADHCFILSEVIHDENCKLCVK